MEKLKSFYEFLSITESLAKEGSEIPPDLTKSSAPYSPTSEAPEKSSSTQTLNLDKYEEYGIDPVEISKDFQNIAKGGYAWKDGSSGMPVDIYFKSESPLFKKPSDGSTYCTGFTFAVGYITCLNRGLLNDLTDSDITKMQKIWNQGDAKTYPKLCVDAIANTEYSNGKTLGEEVTIENVKSGDFCQIWRNTGFGHSVIVLEMIKKDGKTVGIKYYSSNTKINPQTKRSGPGENTEYFTDATGMGGKVLRSKTYFSRISPLAVNIEDATKTIVNSVKSFAGSLGD
jgi:hypothetical protein